MNRKGLYVVMAVLVVTMLAISTGVYAATRSPVRDGVPAVGGQAAAGPAVVTANCKSGKSAVATQESLSNSTISTSYVDVPGMTVTFNTNTACLIVDFTAFSYAPGTALLLVRALLDGATPGSPSEYQFSADDSTWAVSHGANFVFTGVSPGSHTVTIQFRSVDGQTVVIHRCAMSVAHG